MRLWFARHYNPWQVWVARLLIAVPLFWNLQAALQFMLRPQVFVPAFQLEGVPGRAAIAGYGILFLMWQVPYVFALLHPVRFKISLWQALIMQAIGVVAESILLSTIPLDYSLLRGSILRFIIFDGAGVLLLVAAILLIRQQTFVDTRD
ncbi:MAG: hypothetical protein K0B06_10210 [Brevefilum sp.]|nr:hypothetical protein [Brevefilum sp.]